MKIKIGVLDLQTLGEKSDFERLQGVGELKFFNLTSSSEIPEIISDLDVVIVNKIMLARESLEQASRLKLICVSATGTNNIDTDYAASRNIIVMNVRDYCTNSVAQHTFSMLFHLISKVNEHDNYVKSGGYSKALSSQATLKHSTPELYGKTAGIIGLGNIGRRVAQIFTSFGTRVMYYSTSGTNQNALYNRVDLKELVMEADFISIHAPLVRGTENLITSELIKLMKRNVVILNTGRGGIIDESALADGLETGAIRGACLDVFSSEPIHPDSPLLKISDKTKLVLTPHNAWSGLEVKGNLISKVCDNVISFVAEFQEASKEVA